jgi:Raf kinase inhibitor-like YbhB/YbcL family protein
MFVPLSLTSIAFRDGEVIPEVNECDAAGGAAQNLSPPLAWTGGSSAVGSWGIVARDVDADDGGVVQWVIWNIPADRMMLPEGVVNDAMPAEVPGALQAVSYDDVTVGYIGPCAPGNRFRFSVYAMSDATLAGFDATTHRVTVANYLTNFSLGAAHLLGLND